MSAAGGGVRLGLVGKLPAHGDFVRRGHLPASFCGPWDAWLQEGIAAARKALGEARWESVWDAAPAWRFALPAGACGPGAAAGVMLPSRDAVGRRFPLTLAAVREGAGDDWPAAWFATLEGVARAALLMGHDADAVAAALPAPDAASPAATAPEAVTASGADPLAAFWASVDSADPAQASDAAGEAATPDDVSVTESLQQPCEDPSPSAAEPAMIPAGAAGDRATPGWWTAAAADGTPGLVWPLPALPAVEEFVLLLESEA